MKNAIEAGYGDVRGSGMVERILAAQRRKLFAAFMAFRQDGQTDRVLHVGVQPAAGIDKPNYLVAWADASLRARIATHDIVPAGVKGKRSMRLPFADGSVDWVFCNEALEYAGSIDEQLALVKECYRVAGKGVFVTAANRRHPLDFNSGLPLLHWLPGAWRRRLLRWMGKERQASALPLDSAALYRFAGLLPGKPEHDVGHKRVGGMKAHFFLMVHKSP